MKTITEYWNGLTTIRKVLLVIGLIAALPITIAGMLVAGYHEAYRFVTGINY